jgi:hypothetical protein
MTTRASTSTVLSILFPMMASVLMASPARAEPTPPPTASNTVAQASKPDKPQKKAKGAPERAAAGKAKSTARAAKPAKTSASPKAAAEPNDKSTASAKPSQVMDFDNDEVAGQRLEPGFELIEGAPAKARHKSLVEPLKPGDSVVHRE